MTSSVSEPTTDTGCSSSSSSRSSSSSNSGSRSISLSSSNDGASMTIQTVVAELCHFRAWNAVSLWQNKCVHISSLLCIRRLYSCLHDLAWYIPNSSSRSLWSPVDLSWVNAASRISRSLSSLTMAGKRRTYWTNFRLLTFNAFELLLSVSFSTLVTTLTAQPTSFSKTQRNVWFLYLPNCSWLLASNSSSVTVPRQTALASFSTISADLAASMVLVLRLSLATAFASAEATRINDLFEREPANLKAGTWRLSHDMPWKFVIWTNTDTDTTKNNTSTYAHTIYFRSLLYSHHSAGKS